MLGQALLDIRDYLNARTMPGKPYAVGPGVAWTVVTPHAGFAKDLGGVFAQPGLRTFVGILMPTASHLDEKVRGPYAPNQPRAGSIRTATCYLSIFTRSLKAFSHDGALLMYEDHLTELLDGFATAQSETVQKVRLGGMNLIAEDPDYLVMEFELSVTYLTQSKTDRQTLLRRLQVLGHPFEFLMELQPSPEAEAAAAAGEITTP